MAYRKIRGDIIEVYKMWSERYDTEIVLPIRVKQAHPYYHSKEDCTNIGRNMTLNMTEKCIEFEKQTPSKLRCVNGAMWPRMGENKATTIAAQPRLGIFLDR